MEPMERRVRIMELMKREGGVRIMELLEREGGVRIMELMEREGRVWDHGTDGKRGRG